MTRDDRGDRGNRGDRGDDVRDDHEASDDDREGPVVAAIEAGAALYNAGHVLAARGLWESTRGALTDRDGPGLDRREPNTDADGDDTKHGDDRLLRGLAVVATATDHARDGDRSEAADHGGRAVSLLEGIDEGYRGIAVEPMRERCRRLVADPGAADITSETAATEPPPIRVHGVAVGFEDLDLAATLSAAPALATAVDAGDEGTLSAAARLAREERGTGRTQVTELVFAFLRRPEARPQIAARIADHVDLDRREQRDVSGLFE
ncbi:hypothetical protein SAMN04488066_12245 [Halorubrum aquaticum]|uniref:DUF309 domain-containing protein n=1 Tax=Halorubrum aquaticum TaxID=387340 RepID=A0A1I3CGJ3_9EURY|nr:DUF309 domain-containing protein [Halorubrum aquaticum]SFH73632.1 hypothetical protein SAMN04488066_12245 [Halorubrum aquaticum]